MAATAAKFGAPELVLVGGELLLFDDMLPPLDDCDDAFDCEGVCLTPIVVGPFVCL